MPRGRSSEVHAYGFIKQNLKELGWDVRDPDRHDGGQVYTQQECLKHPEIKACFGLERPENVVKVTESNMWIIEAKPDHEQLAQALKEAKDQYADKINKKSQTLVARFVSGVAGNDTDGYLITTQYYDGRKYVPILIHGKEITSLLSPEQALDILDNGPVISEFVIDDKLFLTKAEKINKILHIGAINKNYRARVMACLLLALVEDTRIDVDASPSVLIRDINSRAQAVLEQHSKAEIYEMVKIALPTAADNHIKFKTALVQTIQELHNLNIRSAMNSGADALGKFYEVFLKYGNGAKEIGIVLTPRHITRFAVDTVGVGVADIVYDPTCGTGGFLVSAFDHVRRNSNDRQLNQFKKHNLFGVEQEPEVVALAIVNMIFRGDGKNNIREGNCFSYHLAKSIVGRAPSAKYVRQKPKPEEMAVTRVFMNPPFALKKHDEKEFRFIDRALSTMADGGMLFSVLPYSAMVRPKEYLTWRKTSLLPNNTLLSVITFPQDLFYPVGVLTCGIFVQKGIPHPAEQSVLWLRALSDGMSKSKGKRLPREGVPDDYKLIHPLVQAFLRNPNTQVRGIEQFQKAAPIDFDDPLLELVPENYLDQALPTADDLQTEADKLIRETAVLAIRYPHLWEAK